MNNPSTGLDADGFILTVADTPVQREYQPLLADVCASLSTEDLGLDGIYLYGSVARGCATPGVSDLDLTLVLREPATADLSARLEVVRCALEQRHPHVTKVDFDIGHRAQVVAAENRNSWGFWLKHQCRCLWGNDLSLQFERFRPSRDIALAVNGDFHTVLSAYLTRIARPDVALVNNIAPAHLERMGSLLAVADTKAAIYDALPADGTAVINADDAFAPFFAERAHGRRAAGEHGVEPRDVDAGGRFV